MREGPLAILLSAALVSAAAAGVAGCGSSASTSTASSSTATTHTAAPAASATSPAKQRFLAHFRTDCTQSNRVGADTTRVISTLVAAIGRGDARAVAALTVFLRQLAGSYSSGLAQTRRFGSPPGPDAQDGRAYLLDAQRMVASIRALGTAVGHVNGAAIARASAQMAAATKDAQTAGARYGFPTCAGSRSSSPAPLVGPAV